VAPLTPLDGAAAASLRLADLLRDDIAAVERALEEARREAEGLRATMEALDADTAAAERQLVEVREALRRIETMKPLQGAGMSLSYDSLRGIARAAREATGPSEPEAGAVRGRKTACVEAWPECWDGGYDPRCCRFPKSCSCGAEATGLPPEPEWTCDCSVGHCEGLPGCPTAKHFGGTARAVPDVEGDET